MSNLRSDLVAADAAEATARAAADLLRVLKSGDTMTGDLAMGGHKVTGLADPTAAQDAATRAYVLAVRDALVNGAPGLLDTLGEIAAQMATDESSAAAILTSLNAEIARATTAEGLLIPLAQKAAASGVASLDASSRLPYAQEPLRPTTTKTADYAVTAADEIILANGTITVTLLDPATAGAGKSYTVKNIHASSTVTVSGSVDGASTVSLGPGQVVQVRCTGATYVVTSEVKRNRSGAAPGKTGQWMPASNMVSVTATALSGVSGQATYCYFDVIGEALSISALGVFNNVAAVGGAGLECRLALFADDGSRSYPGAFIADGGTVDLTTAAGQKAASAALALTLPPGRYWVEAKWTFTTVPTTLPQLGMISAAAPGLPGANLGNNYRGYTTTGRAPGASSGSAPAGMSASGATAVVNAGVRCA